MRTGFCQPRWWVVGILFLIATPIANAEAVGVSPGEPEAFAAIDSQCPTFSWSAEAGAGYELEVYEVDSNGDVVGGPVLQRRIPPGATSWMASGRQCLPAGLRYAWFVRAIGDDAGSDYSEQDWSEPLLFEVPQFAVSMREYQEAIDEIEPPGSGRKIQRPETRLTNTAPIARSAGSASGQGALQPRNPAARAGTSDSDRQNEAGQLSAQAAPNSDGRAAEGIGVLSGIAVDAEGHMRATTGDTPTLRLEQDGSEFPPYAWDISGRESGFFIKDADTGQQVFYIDPGAPGQSLRIGPEGIINGDGSGLENVLVSGQQCPPGTLLTGLNPDGSLNCLPQFASTLVDPDDFGCDGTSIAIGSDGNPVIAYLKPYLYLAKCNDPACAGGDETITQIDEFVIPGSEYTTLVIGSNGYPVIASSIFPGVYVVICDDPACSGDGEVAVEVDPDGRRASLAIGMDGFPVLAYNEQGTLDLKVAHCGDSACTPMDIDYATIDPDGTLAQYSSIVVTPEGDPQISYWDYFEPAVKFVKCKDPACLDPDYQFSTVESPVSTDEQIVMRFVGGLSTSIAYYDSLNNRLQFASCINEECAVPTWYVLTVDDMGNVGESVSWASRQVPPPGFGFQSIFSYRDHSSETLKVAHCDPGSCEAQTIFKTVADPYRAGEHTSLAIGADSLPVISYCSDEGLKVLKCRDPQCLN